jgi:hypothetical protein
LAGTTSVGSLSDETQGLRFTNSRDIRSTFRIIDTGTLFAGKVGAIAIEWRVVESALAIWDRRLHDHVGVGGCGEEEDGGLSHLLDCRNHG